MNLINTTRMEAACSIGREPNGREHLVVVAMGTFNIPSGDEEPQLTQKQMPLVEADVFTGEPGLSAPVYEMNFALRKLRCDVLLNGNAYSPDGKPTRKVRVGLKVGSVLKSFNVVGDRVWRASWMGIRASRPKEFVKMPISYDRAFGGMDTFHPNKTKHSAYMQNPVGLGYHKNLSVKYVNNTPLPNTEELDDPILRPDKLYRPMSFGAVGRGWQPRLGLAGTYDKKWLDNDFPFLPSDFSDEYYQAGPTDQQLPYPKGGEEVILLNLTPEGKTVFKLPALELPIEFFPKNGKVKKVLSVVDTVLIEPDLKRFLISWRASWPIKRNIFEVIRVIIGTMPNGWWRANRLGKTYYKSLKDMASGISYEEKITQD